MRTRKKYRARAAFFVLDRKGVAVKAFPDEDSAGKWLASSGLKGGKTVRLSPGKEAARFFDDQIRLGCTDTDVLCLATFLDGTSTAAGFDKAYVKVIACRGKPNRKARRRR